ncbi:MAG: gamma-glutamylcyclotransferase [Halioglobus sp.]|nr:gamma-glutamylcyclotransferase [Halioglobus sp.]
MKYFAYGSNMSIARLKQRAPGAVSLGRLCLKAHDLRFDETGRSGSATCGALHTSLKTVAVMGVLFEIAAKGKAMLDRVEGLGSGHIETPLAVVSNKSIAVEATLYIATATNNRLKPFEWHQSHILMGTHEAQLQADYIDGISARAFSCKSNTRARDFIAKIARCVYEARAMGWH